MILVRMEDWEKGRDKAEQAQMVAMQAASLIGNRTPRVEIGTAQPYGSGGDIIEEVTEENYNAPVPPDAEVVWEMPDKAEGEDPELDAMIALAKSGGMIGSMPTGGDGVL